MDPLITIFVERCAHHVAFELEIENAQYTATWAALNDAEIETECRRIATTDPDAAARIEEEIAQVEEYFAAAAASPKPAPAPTASPRPAPTPSPQWPLPTVNIDCAARVGGDYDWYRIDFGYSYDAGEPIVEWGMDYGDGNSYVASDEADAQQDVYWHQYQAPGSYVATAWVVDSFGRRADDSCTFSWIPGPLTRTNPIVPSNNDYGSDYAGDLDCEDIGEEVFIDGDDPDNLDADGDGIGCEGW